MSDRLVFIMVEKKNNYHMTKKGRKIKEIPNRVYGDTPCVFPQFRQLLSQKEGDKEDRIKNHNEENTSKRILNIQRLHTQTFNQRLSRDGAIKQKGNFKVPLKIRNPIEIFKIIQDPINKIVFSVVAEDENGQMWNDLFMIFCGEVFLKYVKRGRMCLYDMQLEKKQNNQEDWKQALKKINTKFKSDQIPKSIQICQKLTVITAAPSRIIQTSQQNCWKTLQSASKQKYIMIGYSSHYKKYFSIHFAQQIMHQKEIYRILRMRDVECKIENQKWKQIYQKGTLVDSQQKKNTDYNGPVHKGVFYIDYEKFKEQFKEVIINKKIERYSYVYENCQNKDEAVFFTLKIFSKGKYTLEVYRENRKEEVGLEIRQIEGISIQIQDNKSSTISPIEQGSLPTETADWQFDLSQGTYVVRISMKDPNVNLACYSLNNCYLAVSEMVQVRKFKEQQSAFLTDKWWVANIYNNNIKTQTVFAENKSNSAISTPPSNAKIEQAQSSTSQQKPETELPKSNARQEVFPSFKKKSYQKMDIQIPKLKRGKISEQEKETQKQLKKSLSYIYKNVISPKNNTSLERYMTKKDPQISPISERKDSEQHQESEKSANSYKNKETILKKDEPSTEQESRDSNKISGSLQIQRKTQLSLPLDSMMF